MVFRKRFSSKDYSSRSACLAYRLRLLGRFSSASTCARISQCFMACSRAYSRLSRRLTSSSHISPWRPSNRLLCGLSWPHGLLRQFAFPHGDDGPGERIEHLGALQVPFNVAGHLRLPEFHVRLRHYVLRASLVSVQEASVDEDDGPVVWQHETWRAGQPAVVELVSITLAPQSVTHDLLRLRVAGADVGHAVVTLGGYHCIGHILSSHKTIITVKTFRHIAIHSVRHGIPCFALIVPVIVSSVIVVIIIVIVFFK